MNRVFQVILAVTDEESLRAAAAEREEVEHLADVVTAAVVNPARAPLDTGFEILRKTAVPDGAAWVLEVECRVLDEASVITEAKARYAECWGDPNWTPPSIEEALYEVLVASNDSPSPDLVGFEIKDWDSVAPELLRRRVPDKARQIVATLLLRARRAHQGLARARRAGHPLMVVNALEAAYSEAHNAAEVARRTLYHGVDSV